MRRRSILAMTLCLGLASMANAAKLNVGDQAPGLDIESWVKGEEVNFEEGQAYVVEFWATWCGPCKRSIPHLTELQEIFADDGLTIIGISSGEKERTVESFVKQQGRKMNYTVAWDRRSATQQAWMQAAGMNGIPAAFIVDQRGRIQWMGNPLDPEFVEVLPQVVGGRYDARLMKEARPMVRAAENARKVGNWSLAHKHYDELIELDQTIFANYAIEKFGMMLNEQKKSEDAYGYAKKLAADFSGDQQLLADLSRFIAEDDSIDDADRRFDVAIDLAKRAARQTDRNDPDAYEIQALVHYRSGDLDQAIRMQKKAWMVASPKRKAEFRKTLKAYQDARNRATASRG
ncbi:MAG: TlpA disulfide reductase family protein [Planctomycetota bacterium]